MELNTFSDTTKLLGAMGEDIERYDVFLMDIEMQKRREGLDFAHVIREHSKHVPIVFITSHKELAIDGYEVQALHFISKPVDRLRLNETMDQVARKKTQRETSFFSFTTPERTIKRVPMYEVLYLTTYEGDSHFILVNGSSELRFKGKIKDVTDEYADHLVMCHQSYAVNLSHMRAIVSATLILGDGNEIPISKANLDNVRKRFAEFHRVPRND